MKMGLVRILSVVAVVGGVAAVGCRQKPEATAPATVGPAAKAGAALDQAVEKSTTAATNAAEKATQAAQATATATKDVAGQAVEKTGEALEKAGAAVEKTGANMQK